jgi:serine phosphatase RsbU (regulator of sigma subunit)/anti-sigma regulatory factor (Ser/Thr protein kinase)
MALDAILWRLLDDRELATIHDMVRLEAGEIADALDADLSGRIPALRRMAGRWELRGGTPREEFLADASGYAADSGGFQAIEWVDGGSVVRWVVPDEGNEGVEGLDLAFEASRKAALDKARSQGSAAMTGSIELVQGGKGFLVCVPIGGGKTFMGYILAVFKAQDWLTFTLGGKGWRDRDDYRLAVSLDGVPVYEEPGWDSPEEAGLRAEGEFAFLGHSFGISVQPRPSFVRGKRTFFPPAVAATGFILSLLVSFIVLLFQRARREADAAKKATVLLETEVRQRAQAEEALVAAGKELEQRIEERTRSLTEAHNRLMQQKLLEHDLATAGQIQSNLMTTALPEVEGFEFATRGRPSRYLNGDFCDCQLIEGTYCSALLADIAGKGLSAALFASSARALYRLALADTCGSSVEEGTAPVTLLELLNAEMLHDLGMAESFITMVAARLDLRDGRLETANAGGCRIIILDGPSCETRTLDAGGLPVGLFPDLALTGECVRLRPGMSALLYSDGLTEAANPGGELFGLERLMATASRLSRQSAEQMAEGLLSAIEAFQEGLVLADDATLLVIRALPRRFTFDTTTSLSSLDELPLRISSLCFPYGDEVARDMELAVSETLANIRNHGYGSKDGPVSLDLRLETRGVELIVKEQGRRFDPDALPPPLLGELREGGLGIYLIRKVMDEFSYEPGGPDGNLWILFRSTAAHDGAERP